MMPILPMSLALFSHFYRCLSIKRCFICFWRKKKSLYLQLILLILLKTLSFLVVHYNIVEPRILYFHIPS